MSMIASSFHHYVSTRSWTPNVGDTFSGSRKGHLRGPNVVENCTSFLISHDVHGKPCANLLIVVPPELHIITGSDTGIGGSIQLEGILWRRNRYVRGSGRSSNCSCKVVTMTKFPGNCTWHDER